jgi:molybdenum cofactor synthesis domain-containing protein
MTTETKTFYTAAFIVIGNEILSGRTHDVNIHYAANFLNQYGIDMMEARIIPDIEETIIKTVNELRQKFDYVFTSGGIGPTHDDITADSVAKAFNVSIDYRQDALDILKNYYGEANITHARNRMARIPQGAVLIENPVSGAPGFKIENVFVLAGVPKIQRAMLESLVHLLNKGMQIQTICYRLATVESKIASLLQETEQNYATVSIGSYPFTANDKFGVRVILRSRNAEDLNLAQQALEKQFLEKSIEFAIE